MGFDTMEINLVLTYYSFNDKLLPYSRIIRHGKSKLVKTGPDWFRLVQVGSDWS